MSLVTLCLAGWLYGGRALLMPLAFADRGIGRTGSIATWFAIGLLATPLLIAGFAWAGATASGYAGMFVALGLLDAALVGWLVRQTVIGRPARVRGAVWGLLFASLCALLTWFSGPLVEHLSDAWWHMGNIANMRDTAGMALPFRNHAFGPFSSGLFSSLGVDFSTYRLQAILSAATGHSVLEVWYATSVVVSGLLSISVLLLIRTVLGDTRAVVLAAMFWLLILGGMNTGFRLAGWPAGMGYIFLNLGILASWMFWSASSKRKASVLLGVSVAGAALFHLAEVYLLAVGIAILLATALLIRPAQGFRSLLFPVVMIAGIGLAYWGGLRVGRPPSISAMAPALVMVLAAWWIRRLVNQRPGFGRLTAIALLITVIGIGGISWAHVRELFFPVLAVDPGYYNAYIPKYLVGWGERLVLIPKWEHQLRASLLWAGLLAPVLAIWLAWRQPGPRSTWLLALSVAPWLLLISPPLFSLVVSPIPIYGGYRVQYLIPVALVLGQSLWVALANGAAKPHWATAKSLRWLVVAACLLAVTPDLLTRLGFWADRPWAVHTNTPFHWRFGDSREAIRQHTSWPYLEDLQRINQWSSDEPRATFVSDLATSYYVAAESSLQPVIRQEHHDLRGVRLARQYQQFCNGEVDATALLQGVQRYNARFRRGNFEPVRYLITNRDTGNYTAEVHGGACVGEIEHMEPWLSEIAEVAFAGEFLTVWRLRRPVGD